VGQSIYFIQAGFDGPVKIGVAYSPERRLQSLQCGNAYRLRLIGTIKPKSPRGAYRVESMLHGAFADDRLEGEWFRPSDALWHALCSCGSLDSEIPTYEQDFIRRRSLRHLKSLVLGEPE